MEHRRLTPAEEVLREVLRPRSVLNYHRRGQAHWEWDQADGWKCDYGVPRRDLIFTPIFAAILGSANVALWAGGPTLASALSAIAVTAATIGLQYLMMPKPPKPEEMRQPLTQSIPYRFWGVGEARGAGAYMLWESKGKYMCSVQSMIGHRIEEFTQLYLHDDKVTLTGNAVNPVDKRYRGIESVRVYKRVGEIPETAITEIVDLLGGDGLWTANHRGDGQASLGMIVRAPDMQEFPIRFPNGKPVLTAHMKLARCWDFRDEDQDPEDDTTWTWTKNPVLILAWHECFSPFGAGRDFHKAILPVLDMWQEEADVCDEDVPLAVGGTEKRYECGGIDSTKNGPKAGRNAILASMDGWMAERGDGALLIVAGKFREKYCATITDADVVGAIIEHDRLFEEEINRLVPRFTYPATAFTTTDADFFEDTAAQLVAGRVLPQEVNLDWVQQWRQARRLTKREWLRLQEKKHGSIDLRLTGINAVWAPWSRLNTPNMIPTLDGKVIANKSAGLALMKGGFRMSFEKMPDNPADIDAWNPATDEGAAPPIPLAPSQSGIPVPVIDTVAAVSNGNTVYVRVVIIDPNSDDLTPVVHYRVKDIGGGQPGAWVEQRFPDAEPDAGLVILNTNPAPTDEDLEVEAAFIGGSGSYGDWTATEEINSTVDPVAPGTPSALSATPAGADVNMSAKAGNSPNHTAIRFWRADEVTAFGSATDLGAVYGPPNAVQTDTDTPGDGSWRYWATAENASLVQSSPAGPVVARVGLETETVAYLDAFASPVGNAVVLAIDALVAGLKADSLWTKFDWLSLFCLPTQQAALLNLVNPAQTGVAHGTLTFTAGAGFAGDGSTGYIGTGLNVSALTQFQQNSAHLGGWFNGGTGTTSAATMIAGLASGSATIFVAARATASMIARVNKATTLTTALSVNTPAGHSVANRSGATANENYKDGASLGTSATASSARPAVELCFLRSTTQFATSAHVLSIGHFGASLNGTEQAALTARLATFRTAMGL